MGHAMIELLISVRCDGMERRLRMLPQLEQSLVCVGYSFDLHFTSAHTRIIGLRLGDSGGQVSTSTYALISTA
jgi:hypothetical protein